MHAGMPRDINAYNSKSKSELFAALAGALAELREFDAIMVENGRANTAMTKDYMSLVGKCKAYEEEVRTLKAALAKSIQDNKLKTADIFGRSTERLSGLVCSNEAEEIVDEDTAEAPDSGPAPKDAASLKPGNGARVGRARGKKPLGKRKRDLENLPSISVYELDVEELDRLYGENNWRIAYWRAHQTVECIPATVYKRESFVPVVSVGLEHDLFGVKREDVLIKNSVASASLAAIIFYHKFFLALPVYRQETYFKNLGLTLSRQTMNNWVNRLGIEVFSLVYDKMVQLLKQVEYQQCDETYFQVNKDGRDAGVKSYMWVHTTSELVEGHRIIVFCYEPTRGTDHLRKFYKDFDGHITCDAYVSYHLLGEENVGRITISGCMMHLRRRFAKALSIVSTKGIDPDIIEGLYETRALRLIGKIYDEDEPLKALPPGERKAMREKKVRPLLNEFYEYIDGLDMTDPLTSGLMRDAINYSLNQKEYIYRFLDDGNIPIDNGFCERGIRPFTVGRNNWIACDVVGGAETAAIMYTIVGTARENKANVYLYLRYLLEQVPKHLDGKSLDFLDDMMPWSEKYLSYEHTQTTAIPNLALNKNEYDTRPKTPRKVNCIHNREPSSVIQEVAIA